MAIDWDKFDEEVDRAIAAAGKRTDEKLASKMSSVSHLTDEEIQELFPDTTDVRRLKDLMKVVKAAGDRNDKINSIVSNAKEFGGIILTLLGKFA